MQSFAPNLNLYIKGGGGIKSPKVSMQTDTTIKRAKAKDPKALNEIYAKYYPKMVGVCMNIVKEDEDLVRDLVHDAFVLAFSQLSRLRDDERFGEWLTTIVRNVALKHIASKERMHFVPLSQVDSGNDAFTDRSSAADSSANCQDIANLISRLPKGYGKVLRLSAIEGYSHREIADMLGIEPHSSSSQLSRAKGMLKRILGYKTLSVVLVLSVSVPLYLIMSRHGGSDVCGIMPAKEKRGHEASASPEAYMEESGMKARTVERCIGRTEPAYGAADSVAIPSHQDVQESQGEHRTIAESATDSTVNRPKDVASVPAVGRAPLSTGRIVGRKGKWRLQVIGSLGSALAQNLYKSLQVTNIGDIGTDVPSPIFPENIKTWEDYGRYLRTMQHENTPADTLALIGISSHNHGEMIEREVHCQPLSFGISLSKSLNGRWSVETGLQYSLLKSRFAMGEDGYAIVKKQKVHYLGVPLKLSCRILGYRHLSAYSSVGFTLHIPVHGEVRNNYMLDWQAAYTDSHRFVPAFQWQTSLSVGLQYKFAPNAGVFMEPTLNWFIPSGGETHTAWTEHPIMFTCPLGIRVIW